MTAEENYIIRPGTNYSPSPSIFWAMEKSKLKEFYQWFMASLPYCIEELMQLVKGTPGFEEWSADYSPDSLYTLGKWFSRKIKTRELTAEELKEIKASIAMSTEINEFELTDETKSFALYVGMYYGQVAIENKPGTEWVQSFQMVGKRKMVDYGQPVISGAGVVPLNPVRVAHSVAYGCVNDSQKEDELHKAFDYWSKLSMPSTKK